MNMKAEYITPDTLTVQLAQETGAVICASGNATIFSNPLITPRDLEED